MINKTPIADSKLVDLWNQRTAGIKFNDQNTENVAFCAALELYKEGVIDGQNVAAKAFSTALRQV